MKHKTQILYQQGDMLMLSGSVIPKEAKKLGHQVIREGGSAGHKHVAVADTIPSGDYIIGVVCEYAHFDE